MNTCLKLPLLVGLLASLASAATQAALYNFGLPSGSTYTANSTGASPIPDNNGSGVSFNLNFNDTGVDQISAASVTFTISGGYNGDLYAYLSHGDSIVVLLNRIGRTTGNGDGSATSGFTTFTLNSSSATDVHGITGTAGQPLTGTYAPDGRNILPSSSVATFDAANRTATFSTLVGAENPNGNWTLFFADVSPGFSGSLTSWSVSVDAFATPVPEPITWAMLSFGTLFGGLQIRRLLRSRPA